MKNALYWGKEVNHSWTYVMCFFSSVQVSRCFPSLKVSQISCIHLEIPLHWKPFYFEGVGWGRGSNWRLCKEAHLWKFWSHHNYYSLPEQNSILLTLKLLLVAYISQRVLVSFVCLLIWHQKQDSIASVRIRFNRPACRPNSTVCLCSIFIRLRVLIIKCQTVVSDCFIF